MEFDVGCDFGGVSKGKDSIRIGIKLSRDVISLPQADEALCGMRITGRLQRGGKSDAPSQQPLPGMGEPEPFIDGTFDVKRFGVSPDDITFGATFSVHGLSRDNREALLDLANQSGRMHVTGVELIPEDEGDTHDDHEDVGPMPKRGPLAGQRTFQSAGLDDLKRDHGADQPVTVLLNYGATPVICKAVAKAVGGEKISHLEKFMRDNPEYWHRDMKGVGKERITVLQNAWEAFRMAVPFVSDEDRKDLDYAYSLGLNAAQQGVDASPTYSVGTKERRAYELGYEDGQSQAEQARDDGTSEFDTEEADEVDSVEVG